MNGYAIQKYNGVNHDLYLYLNPNNFAANRKNQYFLTNSSAKPDEIIPQERPLSVKKQLIPSGLSEINIFLPGAFGAQLESVSQSYDYDMIIVSNIYADIARQTQCTNPDYLDRLYSPITLYSEDPQITTYRVNKVGCVGFQKVWYPRTPQEYMNELKSGRMPSVISMKLCIDMYHCQRIYCDYNTIFWLHELENYLTTI